MYYRSSNQLRHKRELMLEPTAQTGTSKSVATHAAVVPTENGAAIVYFGWGNSKTFLYDATLNTGKPDHDDAEGSMCRTAIPKIHRACTYVLRKREFPCRGRLVVAGACDRPAESGLRMTFTRARRGERRRYVYSPFGE